MRSRGATALVAVGTVVVGFVVLAGLGGCTGAGGGPEPIGTHTAASPTPTPPPTPSPTPLDPAAVPPERPAAMDTVDTAGAEAFARYFTELFPYVYATGDIEEYRALSHPECIFCADVAAKAEAQLAAGGHSVGGLVEIRDVTALEVDPGKWWAVSMEMVQAPMDDLDRSGKLVGHGDQTAYHVEMAVIAVDGAWQMREVTPGPSA